MKRPVLKACFMHTADEISWPSDASFVSSGEINFGKKSGRLGA